MNVIAGLGIMPTRSQPLLWCALPALALAACTAMRQPLPPTPEPVTALYVVTKGPYPLYELNGDWLANRTIGLPLAQTDDQIMTARRMVLVQDRMKPDDDGPWLHAGCIFDVQRTSADQQEAGYIWAYGRVVRCDELVASGLPEPQMGVRPHELRIFDGLVGYFPMRLLDPYTGNPPPPRQ